MAGDGSPGKAYAQSLRRASRRGYLAAMEVRRVRDIDAFDIALLIGGMALGGVLMATVVPGTNAYDVAKGAVMCGVTAITLRRALRKPAPADPSVAPPPLVGARSLLSGVLVGVGGLVVVLGLGALALATMFLRSPEGKHADGAAGYVLVPGVIVAAGAGMIWAGRRYRRR
jgi:hypothetical protein